MPYRCGRCRRRVTEDLLDDHAENVHGVDALEIDYSPVPGVDG